MQTEANEDELRDQFKRLTTRGDDALRESDKRDSESCRRLLAKIRGIMCHTASHSSGVGVVQFQFPCY